MTTPTLTLRPGDSRTVLAEYPDGHFASVVTDPPYEIAFMGRSWDNQGVAFEPAFWAEVLRVLKPGGHLLAFGGTRTYHRMVCAIEDAGFEVRDSLHWIYGTGFPKSLDVSKAIDKAAGAERKVVGSKVGLPGYSLKKQGVGGVYEGRADGSLDQPEKECAITAPATDDAKKWEGWGTALKPSHEPIVMARKPLAEKTVAANVLAHGTGAINVDACRVACDAPNPSIARRQGKPGEYGSTIVNRISPERFAEERPGESLGRFPANILHDGSPEVLAGFASFGEKVGSPAKPWNRNAGAANRTSLNAADDGSLDKQQVAMGYGDTGTAARFFTACPFDPELDPPFFYCSKASKADRGKGNTHPTVKPTKLCEWLIKLVTPPGGIVLDPFMGSGTTGVACARLGVAYVGIEREPEYLAIAKGRIESVKPAIDPKPTE